MKRQPRIVVCIASHRRERSLPIVLRCLPPDWHAVVVISNDEDPKPYRTRPNTHVHCFDNKPVGRKWQRAVMEAQLLNPDFVVILGSDDVLMTTTERVVKLMKGYDALAVRGLMAYDGKRHYWCTYSAHVQQPIGSARIYSAALLDRMHWQLFDMGRDSGLDNQGWLRARGQRARWNIADRFEGYELVCLKGPWPALNPLQRYMNAAHMQTIQLPDVRNSSAYQF